MNVLCSLALGSFPECISGLWGVSCAKLASRSEPGTVVLVSDLIQSVVIIFCYVHSKKYVGALLEKRD